MEVIEKCVRKLTAFDGWASMLICLEAGYCPTLRGKSSSVRILSTYIRSLGYRVFDGQKSW